MREVLGLFFEYPKTALWKSLIELFKCVFGTFYGEDILQNERNWNHWSPIFNATRTSNYKPQKEKIVGWYTFANQLMVDGMEIDEKLVWSAARRAALHVWIGWIAAFLDWDEWLFKPPFLQNTGF